MSRGIIIGLGSLFGVGVISSIAALKDSGENSGERLLGNPVTSPHGTPPAVNRASKPSYPLPATPQAAEGGFTGYYGGGKKKKTTKKGKKKNVKKHKKSHKKH